jgi:hypothetical protein
MNMKGGFSQQDGRNQMDGSFNILSLIKQVKYKYLPNNNNLKDGNGQIKSMN